MQGLYLLRFDPPYSAATVTGWTKTAGYYLGYADDIARRVHEHVSGGSKSSPLVRAALRQGSKVWLAGVFPGGDRTQERKIKKSRHHHRLDQLAARVDS